MNTAYPRPRGWKAFTGEALCPHGTVADQVTVVYRSISDDLRTQEVARFPAGDVQKAKERLEEAKAESNATAAIVYGLCWIHPDCSRTSPEKGMCKSYEFDATEEWLGRADSALERRSCAIESMENESARLALGGLARLLGKGLPVAVYLVVEVTDEDGDWYEPHAYLREDFSPVEPNGPLASRLERYARALCNALNSRNADEWQECAVDKREKGRWVLDLAKCREVVPTRDVE